MQCGQLLPALHQAFVCHSNRCYPTNAFLVLRRDGMFITAITRECRSTAASFSFRVHALFVHALHRRNVHKISCLRVDQTSIVVSA